MNMSHLYLENLFVEVLWLRCFNSDRMQSKKVKSKMIQFELFILFFTFCTAICSLHMAYNDIQFFLYDCQLRVIVKYCFLFDVSICHCMIKGSS